VDIKRRLRLIEKKLPKKEEFDAIVVYCPKHQTREEVSEIMRKRAEKSKNKTGVMIARPYTIGECPVCH
jgi:hypothetical protein